MTFEQFFFCCYNRSANNFFLGMCRANFFYSNFFRKGRGGGEIGSMCFTIIIILI